MVALYIGLALLGLTILIGALDHWGERRPEAKPQPEDDLAAPYREGLHAAIRMQVVAQDLERQLYVEAARQAEADSAGEQ